MALSTQAGIVVARVDKALGANVTIVRPLPMFGEGERQTLGPLDHGIG